jgi:hypothetical protein
MSLAAIVACGGRTGLENALGELSDGGTSPADGSPTGQDAPSGAATMLLFGGETHPDPTSITYLSDTWTWDGQTWLKVDVQGPPARSAASAATLGNTTVLFGGANAQGALADTWTWDGSSWTQQNGTGPSSRAGAAVATLGATVVLFGGAGDQGVLGDTWTWDGASWTQRSSSGGPSPRNAAVAATLQGRVVLYGGWNNGGLTFPDDTWTWDGSQWTQQQVAGPGEQLADPTALLDCVAGALGAEIVLSCRGQTWVWNGTSWTQEQAAGPNVEGASMSPTAGLLVQFGGFDGVEDTSSTWTWSGKGTWAMLSSAGPSGRSFAAMAAR